MRALILLLALALATAVAAGPPPGTITKGSAHSVAETAERLARALEDEGVRVFARIDHAAGARGAGIALRPTELVIFGEPGLGSHLLNVEQSVGIDLPMKALVWRDVNGKVWLTYNEPAYIARRHAIDNRQRIVEKLSAALDEFTDIATRR